MQGSVKPKRFWSCVKLSVETQGRSISKLLVPESPDNPVWIRVGKCLDGTSAAPCSDCHLVYNPDRILFIGGAGEEPSSELLKPGQNAPDAVLDDYTILPGLIEAHAHLFLEGAELDFEKRKAYLEQSPEDLLRQARNRLEKLLRIGVMTVRDAGDKDGVGLALSADYRSGGCFPMPYLDSPGAAIHHQGRYGSFMGRPLEEFETPEECVDDRIRRGADRIKLIPTGIINFEQGKVTAKPQMDVEEVRELVDSAHSRGKQTFAHASGDDGIENAIEGGVDSVEHGFFIRDDQLARMRDRDIAWVPTFTPVQVQVDHADRMGWNEETVGHLKGILDAHSESLVKAREMGVTVIAGSDAGSCGVAHGLGFLAELERMEAAGVAPIDILRSATGAPAGRLGFHDPIGTLRPGAKARFILTRHSPVESIRNLRKEKVCYFDGVVFKSECDPPTEGL